MHKKKHLIAWGVLFGISCAASCILFFAALWYRYEAVQLKQALSLMELRRAPDRDAAEMVMRIRTRETAASERTVDFMSWKYMLQDELQAAGDAVEKSLYAVRDFRQHKVLANRVYYSLGLVYSAAADMQAAQRFFLEALRFDPRDAESLYNLGVIFSMSTRHDDLVKARGFYVKYLEVASDAHRKSVVQERIARIDTQRKSGL